MADPEPDSTGRKASIAHLEVPSSELRWQCDPTEFDFETTAEVEPTSGVVGQEDALEALRFGLEIHAPGQNVFVRGLVGTGRSTLVQQLLRQIRPACPPAADLCYVHNFAAPDRPRLIELPKGRGALFRDRMDELADFIRDELAPALSSEDIQSRQSELEKRLQIELKAVGGPFEDELRAAGLTVVTVDVGGNVQPAVFPLIDGKPVPVDRLAGLVEEGKLSSADAEALEARVADFATRFRELGVQLRAIQDAHRGRLREMFSAEARRILSYSVAQIEADFPVGAVRSHLSAVVDDVIKTRLKEGSAEAHPARYRANLILEHDKGEGCAAVVESTPTLRNLLGTIDRAVSPQGSVQSDHMMIRAGTLLRANGGYLIMEAADVLAEPGAWKVLMRTLRTGKLEIVPHDSPWLGMGALLHPEPIGIDIKVVLLGDPGLHHQLDNIDPDFQHLFKVLADFDSTIDRNADALRHYAGVVSRLADEGGLLPFHRDAVAALSEHGARVASRRDRLSARFGRLADIAREAEFLARQRSADVVQGQDVRDAVQRTKRRADLPSRKFRQLIREGTIRIHTTGRAVGQVNGLAVTRSGQLTYGFPARITATIGPGTAGTINIEREAMLSGAIHTKGFYILGGLLRHLLRTEHPLAFSASIAFEQSYGGIDGDSASGAEMCCLLSALTEVPMRQDLAMTGAIDQFGNVQAIGAASEKIEGFYDTCVDLGLTGEQGVIVPVANLGDLMLRADVAQACADGKFRVYAVNTVHEALEIFTGIEAGSADSGHGYPPGTLLHRAMLRATAYWRMAAAHPGAQAVDADDDSSDEVVAES